MDDLMKQRAAELLKIPFYAADPGRLGSNGNQTGQPSVVSANGEGMYPSAARTQLVPNPLFRPGSILPEMIPADLAAQLVLRAK